MPPTSPRDGAGDTVDARNHAAVAGRLDPQVLKARPSNGAGLPLRAEQLLVDDAADIGPEGAAERGPMPGRSRLPST